MIAVLWAYGQLSSIEAVIGVSVLFAVVGISRREFIRSRLFLDDRARDVLRIDSYYCLLLVVGMSIVMGFGFQPIVAFTFACIGVASWPAAGGNIFKAREVPEPWNGALSAVGEAWRDGRWTLPGVLVTFLMNHAFTFLLAAVGGLIYTAEVSVARMLVMPISLMNVSIYRVLRPKWASMRAAGNEALIRQQRNQAIVVMLALTAVLGICTYLLWEPIVRFVVTTNYANIGWLVVLWTIVFAAQCVRTAQSSQLQVLGEFRYLTFAVAVSAALVVSATIVLVPLLKAAGVIYAMIAGEIVLIGCLAFRLRLKAVVY
jgi:O-antigen/teichoic acid export membrane protein